MNSSLYFDTSAQGDIELFAHLISAFQFNGIKYVVERDGKNIIVTIK